MQQLICGLRSEDEVMRTVVPVCSVNSVEISGLSLLESASVSLYIAYSQYYQGTSDQISIIIMARS